MYPTTGARFGFTVTVVLACVPVPHELPGVTVMFPEADPYIIVIDGVFCPETRVVPPGIVQEYCVAPVTGLIEYVAEAPSHNAEGPVIAPVAESGVDTVTIAVLVLVQPLAAVPVTE